MDFESDDSIEYVYMSVQHCHTLISVYLDLEMDTYTFSGCPISKHTAFEQIRLKVV